MKKLVVLHAVIEQRFRRAGNQRKAESPDKRAQEKVDEILRTAGSYRGNEENRESGQHGPFPAQQVGKRAARDLEEDEHEHVDGVEREDLRIREPELLLEQHRGAGCNVETDEETERIVQKNVASLHLIEFWPDSGSRLGRLPQ